MDFAGGLRAGLLAHQRNSLDARLAIEIYELNSRLENIERVEPCSDGIAKSWLVPRREAEFLMNRAKGDFARIVALAPEAICAYPVPHEPEVILRFRGLSRAVEGRTNLFWVRPGLARVVCEE
ncbi:MAG: hypothetical protein WBQ89_11585 [Candidatus Acidiferrum sp.]